METSKEIDSLKLAESMSVLTCELAKTCSEKEQYFASLYNLTPAEFKCLKLFNENKMMSIKEIAFYMNITPGRITHILTSLESKKFIKRKIDQVDKRNVQVHLTGKSQPFIKNLTENHIKIHEEILERIDPDKRELVVDLMGDLLHALKDWFQNK